MSRKSFARRTLPRLTVGAGAGEGAAMVGERRREKRMQDRQRMMVCNIEYEVLYYLYKNPHLQLHVVVYCIVVCM